VPSTTIDTRHVNILLQSNAERRFNALARPRILINALPGLRRGATEGELESGGLARLNIPANLGKEQRGYGDVLS
jgi:hypothetical protein